MPDVRFGAIDLLKGFEKGELFRATCTRISRLRFL